MTREGGQEVAVCSRQLASPRNILGLRSNFLGDFCCCALLFFLLGEGHLSLVKSHLMLGDKIVTFKSLRLKPEHITKRNFYQFCKKLKKEKKKSKQEIKGAIKQKRDQVGITTRKCGRGHLSGLQ